MDLHVIPFENVYNFSDPNVALSHWIDLFLDVISKHAPLKKIKRKKEKKKRIGWNTPKKKERKKAGKTPNPSTMAEHWYKVSHVTCVGSKRNL